MNNLLARNQGCEDAFFTGKGTFESHGWRIEEAHIKEMWASGDALEIGDIIEVSEDGGENWFEVEITDIEWNPSLYMRRR